ncbi:MAG: polysaccharide pyruvyl transferase CsaB [Firmicutes bacterium HGW-Firmicutes-7]|nr:MAG: polysaccharide pyruvyl transferase CsaB [Firmicutes bacterium HGW-Firmicutes-7]
MKKILITGYYGYSNSGDDAILSSICKDIKQLDSHEITILSNNPEETISEYDVNAIYRFKFNLVRAQIKTSDIVLMGGGSLLQDKTSTRSLFYYLFIIWYAKLHKKKCMLYANGIGPINKAFNRRVTKWIVNKADVITLRESLSNDELQALGINKPKIYITADPVFNLPYVKVDVNEIFKNEGVDTTKPLAAVLFRNWLSSDSYIHKTAELCDYITNQYDMHVVLIPMKYPTDIDISEEILKSMKNKAFILKQKHDVSEMIEIIGATKVVLSMRLHSLLYAAIQNVPMIGFIYDPKVEYYIRELNMYSAGDVSNFDLVNAKDIIDEIMRDYVKIQEQLAIKVGEVKKKAVENREILGQLIKELEDIK